VESSYRFLKQNLDKKNIVYVPSGYLVGALRRLMVKESVFCRVLEPTSILSVRKAIFHQFQDDPNGVLLTSSDVPFSADNVIAFMNGPGKEGTITHEFNISSSGGDLDFKEAEISFKEGDHEQAVYKLMFGVLELADKGIGTFADFEKTFERLGVTKVEFTKFLEGTKDTWRPVRKVKYFKPETQESLKAGTYILH